jgi:hypothetical protein
MPIGFAKHILASSAVSSTANTQAADWTILAGHTGFSGISSPSAFGTSQMSDFDGSVDDTDSTITLYPSDTSFRFNTNFAYTIEFWLAFTNTNSLTQSHDIFKITLDDTEGLEDTANNYGRVTANGSLVYFDTNNVTGTNSARSNFTSSTHVAIVSNGSGTQNWYVNGSRVVNDSSYTYNGNASSCAFGFRGTRAVNGPRAVFDEIRISNTERYSGASYTVPTSAFTTDENTLALFHCDGNRDDSSRG